MTTMPSPWAVILAGGDGTRLRPLTQRLTGDSRPKQFCRLLGDQTLLDRTRRRADLVIRSDRQLIVVTRAHERYYADVARELSPGRLVVQPENRGTGPAIALGAIGVRVLADDAPMVVLPSDHDIVDEGAFMDAAREALGFAAFHPGSVILLGLEPDSPEPEYGWIEPRIDSPGSIVPVRRFWEKPSAAEARVLLERGCLWNSFVMVGWASSFLAVIEAAAPELSNALRPYLCALGTARQRPALEHVYAALSSIGFSERVLSRLPEHFSVMRVKDVGWYDLGHPERVIECARRRGVATSWSAA